MKQHRKMFAVIVIFILAASAWSAPRKSATMEEAGFRRNGFTKLDNIMRRATRTT